MNYRLVSPSFRGVLAAVATALLLVLPAARQPRAQEAATPQGMLSARHILIAYEGAARSEATRTKEEAEALAKEVYEKVKAAPANFGSAAQEYSDGPTGPQGGFLGVFNYGAMTPPFEEAVVAAKEWEVVGPVETDFGFHIIQRLPTEIAPRPYRAVVVAYGETATEIGVGERTKEDAMAIAQQAIDAVKGGMEFADAAKKFSDAPSKEIGGYQGELVYGAAFPPGPLDAAMALEEGGTSEAVATDRAVFVVHYMTKEDQEGIEVFLNEAVDLNAIFLRYSGALNATEEDTRTKEETQALAEDIVAKTKAGESFEDFAVQFNSSKMLKDRRGSLGKMKRRVLPPALADLAFGLAIGEAGYAETHEGFVVLQRVEMKEEAAPATEATEATETTEAVEAVEPQAADEAPQAETAPAEAPAAEATPTE